MDEHQAKNRIRRRSPGELLAFAAGLALTAAAFYAVVYLPLQVSLVEAVPLPAEGAPVAVIVELPPGPVDIRFGAERLALRMDAEGRGRWRSSLDSGLETRLEGPEPTIAFRPVPRGFWTRARYRFALEIPASMVGRVRVNARGDVSCRAPLDLVPPDLSIATDGAAAVLPPFWRAFPIKVEAPPGKISYKTLDE